MSDCLLTTTRVQRWLVHSQEVRILHLFAEVCNLVNESGEVISLVSRRIGAGPFALVMETPAAWPEMGAEPVWIDRPAARLHAGALTICYANTPCWHPKPAWYRLRPLSRNRHASLPALAPDFVRLLQLLLDGLRHRQRTQVRRVTTQLAGRGQGLTPTGDDLLVGVLYALQVWGPRDEWPALIAETAAPRTTTLSAAFLRAAAAGEATAPWHRLAMREEGAVAQIVATGHQSGAETWAAFTLAAERLCQERS